MDGFLYFLFNVLVVLFLFKSWCIILNLILKVFIFLIFLFDCLILSKEVILFLFFLLDLLCVR